VLGERSDDIDALPRSKQVDVVEDQRQRTRRREQGRREPPQEVSGRPHGSLECVEDGWVDRRNPAQRQGDVLREGGGIVVFLVDRKPGEGPLVTTRPLPDHGGLSIPGGSENGDDRPRAGSSQAVDQRSSRHAPRSNGRRAQLRVEQVEGDDRRKLDESRFRVGIQPPGSGCAIGLCLSRPSSGKFSQAHRSRSRQGRRHCTCGGTHTTGVPGMRCALSRSNARERRHWSPAPPPRGKPEWPSPACWRPPR
jgi:hypothetical protein